MTFDVIYADPAWGFRHRKADCSLGTCYGGGSVAVGGELFYSMNH
jgi:hypothetical protein